jgi:hypothetical protein
LGSQSGGRDGRRRRSTDACNDAGLRRNVSYTSRLNVVLDAPPATAWPPSRTSASTVRRTWACASAVTNVCSRGLPFASASIRGTSAHPAGGRERDRRAAR